ncbi:MAG: FtsX-like permease family protein [Bryobacteraceae bacterium]|nr:FtsX-like permease family protein [Bryobacteraceae bacterium]
MISAFELFVAIRYLRARRKQAVISVITVISVVGVAAGVMAMVIALAINNGFRGTLQRNLLGATAHVSVLEKAPGEGITGWEGLAAKVRTLPHVVDVAPGLYGQVLMSGPQLSSGAVIKGVDPDAAGKQTEMLGRLKSGSLARLKDTSGLPGIILGKGLAQSTGMMQDAVIQVIIPNGELTPFGPRAATYPFRVAGIFESGFYELDATWAYVTLGQAQRILSVPDVVNSIEIKLDEIYRAPEVAAQIEGFLPKTLAATTWMEQNKPILSALKMERAVTMITIGLIQGIAALNILIALVMAVMEKYKDIAILMSMGARQQQVRNIFVLQGVLIGITGSAIGLTLGYTLSYMADRYRWITLDAQVYSLAYVPFDPRPLDALWIAGIAIAISFLATLYPARNATKIVPVEALRYE